MLISVTQEDIELGSQANASKCMLARALTRAFGETCWVGAGMYHIAGGTTKPLPPIADDAYRAFDRDRNSVSPFTFELPEPTP